MARRGPASVYVQHWLGYNSKETSNKMPEDFSAAASLFSAATKVRGRFWKNRYGPSRRRAQNASAALKNFVRHPKKTFSTLSALLRHADCIKQYRSSSAKRKTCAHAEFFSV